MAKQSFDPRTLLFLSQSAVDSSDQALRAAEAALSAAQAANNQAKNALKAVTEAIEENRKLEILSEFEKQRRMKYSSMDCESDAESEDEFYDAVQSTNNNLVNDIEVDSSEDGDFFNDPNFIMISSTGPAAQYQGDKMGLYRRSDEMRDGRSVYIQEQDDKHEDSPCELVSVKGGWLVKWLGNLYMFVPTLSKSPTSVKWQYYQWDDNTWRNDQDLKVKGLSTRPSDCEIRISLKAGDLDIVSEGWEGVYKADGSYHQGRPVLRHSGGQFTLSCWDGCWEVSQGVGGEGYLWGGAASSPCTADWEKNTDLGDIIESLGFDVKLDVNCIVKLGPMIPDLGC